MDEIWGGGGRGVNLLLGVEGQLRCQYPSLCKNDMTVVPLQLSPSFLTFKQQTHYFLDGSSRRFRSPRQKHQGRSSHSFPISANSIHQPNLRNLVSRWLGHRSGLGVAAQLAHSDAYNLLYTQSQHDEHVDLVRSGDSFQCIMLEQHVQHNQIRVCMTTMEYCR